MEFTPFENSLIRWYVDHAPHEEFKNQLQSCAPSDRSYSGAGLFIELSIQPGSWSKIPDEVKSPVSGPNISSPSLKNGAGSILFLKDGLVDMLEVYTFDDEMSEDLAEYDIGIELE